MEEFLGGIVQRVLQLHLRDELLHVFYRVFWIGCGGSFEKKKILLNQMQTSVVASECSVSCASRDLV